MKARGAQAKGRKFDHKVALLLSGWYFGVPDALMRTHGSRGRKGFVDQIGDLGIARSDLNKKWVFGVENKCRDRSPGPLRIGIQKPAWTFDDLLQQQGKASIYEYWEQCHAEAINSQKIPLLVMTRKYHKPVAGVMLAHWLKVPKPAGIHTIRAIPSYVVFMLFSDFLRTDPASWIDLWRDLYDQPKP